MIQKAFIFHLEMDLYTSVCTVGLSDLRIAATTSLMETQSGTSWGTEKLSFFPVLLIAQPFLTFPLLE